MAEEEKVMAIMIIKILITILMGAFAICSSIAVGAKNKAYHDGITDYYGNPIKKEKDNATERA